ncbi:MAG: Fe-S cluster assembly protein SufD [Gemmatimonadales bacterium]|nr:Fe-S cluster assembly protein SufD [Gemmatimonadales bacterium]
MTTIVVVPSFAELIDAPRSAEPAWLAARRTAAAERFAMVGIPSSRDEEWRFTPVSSIASTAWTSPAVSPAVTAADIAPLRLMSGPLAVLVDGRFVAELSTIPAGLNATSLQAAIAAGDPAVEAHLGQVAPPEMTPFSALSLATFVDGVVLHLNAGVTLEAPLEVLHLTTAAAEGALVAPRVLVTAGAGARGAIIEQFVSLAGTHHLTNTVTELVLAPESWVEHVRVQREGEQAWHIGFTHAEQAAASHYRSFALAMGAKLSRHNLHARLAGEQVETLMYGLYLTRDSQLADTHSAIFHDQPNCNSWEVYKGVLDDTSRAVFNGKVFVEPIAQKTDAKQTNRNLLLSDTARVDTKPQLEIFADDVKCTHGATVGRLNEQQRYYLQTRGIGGRMAQELLIWAFAAEVLTEVTIAPVRQAIEVLVRERLDEMLG